MMHETIHGLQVLLGDIPLGLEHIHSPTYTQYVWKDRGGKDVYLCAKVPGDSGRVRIFY